MCAGVAINTVKVMLKIVPVRDMAAEKLEAAGLWRRAATRWLSLLKSYNLTDGQREWLLLRQKYCLRQVASVQVSEVPDAREIGKAADAVLAAMGLASPNGRVFRRYPSAD